MSIHPLVDPDPDAKPMRKPEYWDSNHRIHAGFDQPEWEIVEELQRNFRQNRRLILS